MPRAKASEDSPTPKKRRGRPPKASSAKAPPTNGRRKRRVGRPPKAETQAAGKKRVGRPPKGEAASAGARKRRPVAEDDGRRVPVSTATTRAIEAVARTADALKKERAALADAVDASDAARAKARSTGLKRDKTAAKKARQKVQRLNDKVATRRTAAREAKANVTRQKAEDLLKARLNNVDVRLQRAEEAANERIQAKLDRQTEKFRTAAEEKLNKAEARKAKVRERQADADREALQKKYEATIRDADESLIPKERKRRRRRRKAQAS